MTKKNHEIEYSFTRAFTRVCILLIIIYLCFIGYLFYKEFTREELIIDEEEEILSMIYQKQSRGDFFSINKEINVQGNLIVEKTPNTSYIHISNFKITNRENTVVYLATHPKGRSLYKIQKLNSNIGNFQFEISSSINLSIHQYLLYHDVLHRENLAFAKLTD